MTQPGLFDDVERQTRATLTPRLVYEAGSPAERKRVAVLLARLGIEHEYGAGFGIVVLTAKATVLINEKGVTA